MTDLMFHALAGALIACVPMRLDKGLIAILLAAPFIGEIVQIFMVNRTASLQDAFIGVCGVSVIVALRILYREIAPSVRRYRQRRKHWRA
jgi:hypothetical protein